MMIKSNLLLSGAMLLVLPVSALAQNANDGDSQNIEVTELLLDKLVVSAGAEKVAIDTPQAVTTLDQEAIDQAQATTIGDLLEEIPGVSIQGGASALGQGFNIRGLGTGLADSDSRILMTVDGVSKFFEQYRMGAFFSEPELYKRVEVLRGPASSTLYGAGVLAGVVNFTTKDASDYLENGDKLAVRLKGSTETNGDGHTVSGIVALEPVKGVELLGNYNYRRVGHYKDGNGKAVVPSNAKSDSFLIKGRVAIGGNNKHAFWASYQDWISDSTQVYDQSEALATLPVRRKVHDKTAVFGYVNDFGGSDIFNVEAQISYADSKVHQTETAFLGNLEYSTFSYGTKQAKIQNASTFELGDDWSAYLTIGGQWSEQKRRNPRKSATTGIIAPGSGTHPEGDMTKYGLFAQTEIMWSDKLTIIPGVRMDWTDMKPGNALIGGKVVPAPGAKRVKDSGLSPKIAAIYAVTDWFSLFGSVARTLRMPVLDELYSRTNAAGNNINFSLRPEKSNNIEGGFTLSFKGIAGKNDRFLLKATTFQNSVKDLITRGTANAPSFVNVGRSRFKGVEIEAEYGYAGFFARGNASFITGRDRLNNRNLNTIPANEYHLTLGYADVATGLSGGWRAEFAEAQNKVSVASLKTPGYSVHNLFFGFKPQSGAAKGFEFRISVGNVFDKQFQRHLSSLHAEGQTFKFTVANTF